MSNAELQTKILGMLYDRWFENWLQGLHKDIMISKLRAPENDIEMAIDALLNKALINDKDRTGRYTITNYGIDSFERLLPASAVSKRVEQRSLVMETLKPLYETDTKKIMKNMELAGKVNIQDFFELYAVVKYLDNRGLVFLQPWMGKEFDVRLTSSGYESFQHNEFDASIAMSNAYSLLFRLENHLRRFVESKMRKEYGAEWWDKVSQGTRKQVDDMKKDESELGWQIAESSGPTDYLLFGQLEGIIAKHWNPVFKPIFKDQEKLTLKLKELEKIRNSIAHTRTLSMDAMTRLEQYSNDIFTLIAES